ncbi:MAG: hypothetical protein U0V73_12140 [Acidimicrobiia bacterium]
MERWDAERALVLVERWRVASTHMVPVNFTRIFDVPAAVRERYDLSSPRLVVYPNRKLPVPT